MRHIFLLISICLFHKITAQTQGLSSMEKSLMLSIDRNMPETRLALEKAVNTNSGTLNKLGVKAVGEQYKLELEAMGFKTEWIGLPDSMNRAGHLVASIKGTKGKKLFLIGHLDTVFEPSMPEGPFKVIDDSTATGQGLNDMKGGNAVILASLKALYELGLLKDRSITVYFTGDEESSGKPSSISRADFIKRAKEHDIALAYETAMGLHLGTTARRGICGWQLSTKGKTGHSSGIFNQNMGFGAIYEAARILENFESEFRKIEYLTVNPGIIVGGTEASFDIEKAQASAIGKSNIVAQKVIVNGDLRFISEKQKKETQSRMKEIVAKNLHRTSASIIFTDGIPAMEPKAANSLILEDLNRLSLDMAYGEVKACDPGLRGAGDISYIADFLPCLDGLGASGFGAHSPGETINLNEFPKLIKRNTLFLYRYLK
jgi:glutamate carboxypeptidase